MDKYGQLMIDSKKTINKWEQEFYKDHARKPSKVLMISPKINNL